MQETKTSPLAYIMLVTLLATALYYAISHLAMGEPPSLTLQDDEGHTFHSSKLTNVPEKTVVIYYCRKGDPSQNLVELDRLHKKSRKERPLLAAIFIGKDYLEMATVKEIAASREPKGFTLPLFSTEEAKIKTPLLIITKNGILKKKYAGAKASAQIQELGQQ